MALLRDAIRIKNTKHFLVFQMLTDFLVGAPVDMALRAHLRLLEGTTYTSPNPAFHYVFGIGNGARSFGNLQGKGSRELYGEIYAAPLSELVPRPQKPTRVYE